MLESDIDAFFSENFPDGRKLRIGETESFPEDRMYGIPEIWCGWEFQYKDEIFYVILGKDYPHSQPVIFVKQREMLEFAHIESDSKLCWISDGGEYDPTYKAQFLTEAIEKTKDYLDKDDTWHEEAFSDEILSYWSRHKLHSSLSDVLLLDDVIGTSEAIVCYKQLFQGATAIVAKDVETIASFVKDYLKEDLELNFDTTSVIELSTAMVPAKFPTNCKKMFKFIETYAVCPEEAIKLFKKCLLKMNGSFPIILNFTDRPRLHLVVWVQDAGKPILKKGFRSNIEPKKFLALKRNDIITPITFSGVKYGDVDWLYERGSSGVNSMLQDKRVLVIGCGSLGAGILKLLVKSGIRNLDIIDKDSFETDNLMRHELSLEYVGINKAKALESDLKALFPGVLQVNGHISSFENYYHENPKFYCNFDLIIDVTANRSVMSMISDLQVKMDTPPIIHAWLEAYAVAGHAIVTTGLAGCLECGFRNGDFVYALASWNKSTLTHLEGCGITYQSYGMTDIVPVQAMVARTAIEVLEGKMDSSQHRVWIGNTSIIQEMDGSIRDEVIDYYGYDGRAHYETIHTWKAREECSC